MIFLRDLLSTVFRSERILPSFTFNIQADPFNRIEKSISSELTSDRLCGVEIEIERFSTNPENSSYEEKDKKFTALTGISTDTLLTFFWRKVSDGSLRNGGLEFITTLGTNFKLAPKSIKMLELYLSMFSPKAETNARTGLHVHIDVRDLRLIDLQRFLMVYLCFEEALFNYSGSRQNNIFCVPFAETFFPLYALKDIHSAGELGELLQKHSMKYTGLNLLPILEKGTIEFRMHRGTYSSYEIINWLQLLQNMFNSVLERGIWSSTTNLENVLFNLEETKGFEAFAQTVFGGAYFLIAPYLKEEDILKGISDIKELSISVNKIPEEFYVIPKKKKKLKSVLVLEESTNVYTPGPFDRGREVEARQPAEVGVRDNVQRRVMENQATLTRTTGEIDIFKNRFSLDFRYTDMYGFHMPNNLPPEDRATLDERIYVHKDSEIYVIDISGEGGRHIIASNFSLAQHIFLYVIAHGHTRGR